VCVCVWWKEIPSICGHFFPLFNNCVLLQMRRTHTHKLPMEKNDLCISPANQFSRL
jgi:hypothetical protein